MPSRAQSAAPHRTRVEVWSWATVAVCSCGWIGADQGKDERGAGLAAAEGARHENEPAPPALEAWRPGDNWGR